MTIDDQLREIARHADQHQRVITADEIVRRAPIRQSICAPERRRGRHWVLAAAAAIARWSRSGCFAVNAGNCPDSVRTSKVPSTSPTTTVDIPLGSIAFAADAGAGDALTDPVGSSGVETDPQPMDIYVTREGEPTRRLTSSSAHERCPAFSPDGQRLAYLEVPASGGSLAPSIVVRRLNAARGWGVTEMRVLLPASEAYGVKLNIGVPAPWSPDGSRLAYLAYPQSSPMPEDAAEELRVSTLDGEERVVNAGRPAYAEGPFAWSPDGDAIAYAGADGVWRAPLDGGAPSLVWRTDGKPTAVSWSSRGELAVTVQTTVPVEGGSRDVLSVHVVDVDTRQSADARHVIHVYDTGLRGRPTGRDSRSWAMTSTSA